MKKSCLTIGGSHPTSQAGIQTDLLCSYFWQTYCSSIVSTVTAQNKYQFIDKVTVSSDLLEKQIISNLEVLPKPYVKIGMINNKNHYNIIKKYKSSFSYILLDPIISTTTGEKIITIDKMVNFIKLYCDFITPNFEEFKLLSKNPLDNEKNIKSSLKNFSKEYKCSIFLKGGHSSNASTDYLINEQQIYKLYLPSLKKLKTSHGTGCRIAISILCNIANEKHILEATINAKSYVYDCLQSPAKIGNEYFMNKSKNFKKIKENVIVTKLK